MLEISVQACRKNVQENPEIPILRGDDDLFSTERREVVDAQLPGKASKR